MALTPEHLNEVKKLGDRELLLLTYETAVETREAVQDLKPKVAAIERTHTILKLAWVAIAGVVGLKLKLSGVGK